ncbi:peptidoglycan DD-metalloendopeptidase family protein [Alteribacillus bidgolensis]|uniref:LysM domain-containing protein n=1 Tax=Alteribacillus bidgolensis TaxID=930129 RepID=A0A1G8C119_9BACI|nr:peptidoglycan DD-metalloendopeptidase family protein [Alteribacillus bidgolensis]SDH39105.1 LysM domain-containing protein [Alteribacillus bidgolensis]
MNYMRRFVIVGIFSVVLFLIYLFIGVSATYAREGEYIWPVHGEISDTFGTRDGTHYGIDIAAEKGTKVYAVKKGEIVKSYFSSSYGNVIIVGHKDNEETLYAHLDKRLKEKGDLVNQGEVIGTLGNTGHSTGPHLHFELHEKEWREDKKFAEDPLTVLNTASLRESKHSTEVRSYDTNRKGSSGEIKYKVHSGDTLWEIAKQHGTSVEVLMESNKLNDSVIETGQLLILP